jgi:hypothetical protein
MKTWFITGAARAFGRIWTEAALTRGDKVPSPAPRFQLLAFPVAPHDDKTCLARRRNAHDSVRSSSQST